MKTVGLIDFYMDQYHAENYPGWIKEASGGAMEVAYAWAKTDKPGGKSNADCCREAGIRLLDSPEEVVRRSDCLIVMSPDNPEMHEELCGLPLASGKPTYVDKTFAPDRAAALRLIHMAREGRTPFFSSSALRFAREYATLQRDGIEAIHSRGPGSFDTYSIHQLEPIICLMGPQVKKIIYVGCGDTPALVLRFADNRVATVAQLGWECDFSLAVNYRGDRAVVLQGASDFYQQFIKEMVGFFDDGIPRVTAEETLQVMTILEFGRLAARSPDTWIELPSLAT
jgi:hypothetical protein